MKICTLKAVASKYIHCMRLRYSNNLQVVRPKCKFIQHSWQNMPSEGESVYFNNDILMLQNLEWKGFFQV